MLFLSRHSPDRVREVLGTPLTITGLDNNDDDGSITGTMVFGHDGVSPVTWTVTAPDGTDATAQLDDDTSDAPVLTRSTWVGPHGGTWTVQVEDANGNVGIGSFIVGRLHAGMWWVKVYEVDFTAEAAHDFNAGGPEELGTPARTWTRLAGGDGLGNEILAADGGYKVNFDDDGLAGITTPFEDLLGTLTPQQAYALMFRAAGGQIAGLFRRAGVQVADPTSSSSLLFGHSIPAAATIRRYVAMDARGEGLVEAGSFAADDSEVSALVVKGLDADLRTGAWAANWPTLDSLTSEQTVSLSRGPDDDAAWSFDGDMTVGLVANRDATAGDWAYTWKEFSAWVAK